MENVANVRHAKAVRAAQSPSLPCMSKGKMHHVGRLDGLENEMISWQPGSSSWSPNRIDALVWVLTELMTGETTYGPICVSVPIRSILNHAAAYAIRCHLLGVRVWAKQITVDAVGWEIFDSAFQMLSGLNSVQKNYLILFAHSSDMTPEQKLKTWRAAFHNHVSDATFLQVFAKMDQLIEKSRHCA
jgi:hypothetical protein